jgi:hypothetical protein
MIDCFRSRGRKNGKSHPLFIAQSDDKGLGKIMTEVRNEGVFSRFYFDAASILVSFVLPQDCYSQR